MESAGLTINATMVKAHTTATNKGFWDKPISFLEGIALITSELSEAVEFYRGGYEPSDLVFQRDKNDNLKPDGIPAEMADAVIRICDLCAYYDIDLEQAILEKMQYNQSRPYMHGKII